MRILYVEDEPEMARTVVDWLKSDRFEVIHFSDGQIAYEDLLNENYDLLILDWELPGISGMEICKRYRERKGSTPILMLTGRGSLDDRVAGLDFGADDYLSKPFSLKELSARVRALLRRPADVRSNVIEVGKLKLDTIKHRLSVGEKEIQLMPRDFALLEFLMQNPGEVFSSEALLSRVWSRESDVGPDALRTSIKRIRKKIDASENESDSLIENVPRIGYRLRN